MIAGHEAWAGSGREQRRSASPPAGGHRQGMPRAASRKKLPERCSPEKRICLRLEGKPIVFCNQCGSDFPRFNGFLTACSQQLDRERHGCAPVDSGKLPETWRLSRRLSKFKWVNENRVFGRHITIDYVAILFVSTSVASGSRNRASRKIPLAGLYTSCGRQVASFSV